MCVAWNGYSFKYMVYTLQFFYKIESAYNSFFFSPKQKKDRVVLPLNLDEYVSWGLFNGASQGILGPME